MNSQKNKMKAREKSEIQRKIKNSSGLGWKENFLKKD